MLRLAALLHFVSCSSDILYSLRGQDVLRHHHRYGQSNIYGIKSVLSRREIAPFPLIYALDRNSSGRRLKATDSLSTVFAVTENSTGTAAAENIGDLGGEPVPIVRVPRNETSIRFVTPTTMIHGVDYIAPSGVAIQIVEVRKVKRIGGGYPYGPRNFSVVEFPYSLKVEKSLGNSLVFKTRNVVNGRSTITDQSNVWSIKRFEPPSTICNVSLSCSYCVTYWKMQTKFKPSNIYTFCCK